MSGPHEPCWLSRPTWPRAPGRFGHEKMLRRVVARLPTRASPRLPLQRPPTRVLLALPPRCLQARMKVYTKTGDKGTSQLFSGERRPKDDAIFKALGDTDELNGQIGVAIEYLRIAENEYLPSKLEQIQSRLFDLGACVATPLTTASQTKKNRAGRFDEANVDILEQWIDEMDAELPPLKVFILPSGGGLASTHLHVARSVCRRAERRVVPLESAGDVESVVIRYLNRLSDFLFVAARYAAFKQGKEETKWQNQNIRPARKDSSSSEE